VQHVLGRYLEDDTHFVEAVNLGLAAAARGEFVEHEEVGKKLKEILLP
jgi:predicted transcriptional regulator